MGFGPLRFAGAGANPRSGLVWPLVIVGVALGVRAISFLPDDVSWFLTVAERTWQGERAYVDFFDPNLPAAFLIYLPAVLIGRWLDIPAEPVVTVMTVAAGCAGVWFCLDMLVRHGVVAPGHRRVLAALALFAVLVLPCHTFAQREHIALIATLPVLSVYIIRAHGGRPGLAAAVAAGAAAALAVAIKPFFALAVLHGAAYLALRDRGKPFSILLAPENVVAAGLTASYAAAIVCFFPGYIHTMLLPATAVYSSSHPPLAKIVLSRSVIGVAVAAAAMLLAAKDRLRRPEYLIPALAAAGFVAAFFIQGKYYPYHSYPAVALFLLGAAAALAERLTGLEIRKAWRAVAVFGFALVWVPHDFRLPLAYPGDFHVARAVSPLHPRVIAFTRSLIGPQLARYLHGSWVLRQPSLYLSLEAERMLNTPGLPAERRRRIEAVARWDAGLAEERMRTQRPDLMITDRDGLAWAQSQPAIARQLLAFRKAGATRKFAYWIRRR